jgi:preprotein translocase subunit YajC
MKLFIFVAIFMILYLKILRPWQLRWGATDDEVNCAMLGDDIVQKPNLVATRAVSIHSGIQRYP